VLGTVKGLIRIMEESMGVGRVRTIVNPSSDADGRGDFVPLV
jgi:hypothetical protein